VDGFAFSNRRPASNQYSGQKLGPTHASSAINECNRLFSTVERCSDLGKHRTIIDAMCGGWKVAGGGDQKLRA
jgi:hypothetical protein